jgi:hypothetical protein
MATKFWHSCCDHVTVDGNSSATENRLKGWYLPHELGLGGSPDKDSDEAACCHCDFRQDTELCGLGPNGDCTKNFKVNADVQSL